MNKKDIQAELKRLGVAFTNDATQTTLKQQLDTELAIVADVKKQLKKYEIDFDETMAKGELQALLEQELAKRASGEDESDKTATEGPGVSDEPVMSEEERQSAYEEANLEMLALESAAEETQEKLTKQRMAVAKLLPPTRQANLSDCVNGFKAGVTKALKDKHGVVEPEEVDEE